MYAVNNYTFLIYQGALNIYTDISTCIQAKCAVHPSPSITTTSESLKISPSIITTTTTQQQVAYNKPIGLLSRLLVDADIGKLLLLILTRPSKMRAEHSQTIEIYSWFQALTTTTPQHYLAVQCMSRDLFIMLQSFMIACQSNDMLSLHTLQTELAELFDPHSQQVHVYLIDLIVAQLLNSSYTDDLLSQ